MLKFHRVKGKKIAISSEFLIHCVDKAVDNLGITTAPASDKGWPTCALTHIATHLSKICNWPEPCLESLENNWVLLLDFSINQNFFYQLRVDNQIVWIFLSAMIKRARTRNEPKSGMVDIAIYFFRRETALSVLF